MQYMIGLKHSLNFGNYSAIERMQASFADFEKKFGGKVFVVFSLDGEIANKEIIKDVIKILNN
jgi:hypothetical protein